MIPTRPSKRIRQGATFDLARTIRRLRKTQDTCGEGDWDSLTEIEWKTAVEAVSSIGKPQPESARRHLGYSQNDAFVIDLRIGRDDLELVLNHYDIWRLATAAGLGYMETRRAFPVIFRFKRVSRLAVQHLYGHGEIQKIRASIRTLCNRLYDIVAIEIGQRPRVLEAVIVAHGPPNTPLRDGWGTSVYFISLTADSVEVDEEYREGWARIGGPKLQPLLERFDPVWPVQHWSVDDFKRFVEEQP